VDKTDPYLLSDANVLDNCFGEKNHSRLQEHEIFFSGLRIRELIDDPLTGKLDYDLLLRIHAYIFQDLYPSWAGATRTIAIAKRERLLEGKSVKYSDPGKAGTRINTEASALFDKLEQDCYLQGLDDKAFCAGLAAFLSTLWKIHPFREGNTRSIMVLCYHLTRQAGYCISLKYIDNMHRELRNSLVFSMVNDVQRLEDFLFRSIYYDDRSKGLFNKILYRLEC